MACLKTCKKRQDLFSAEQSEIENKFKRLRTSNMNIYLSIHLFILRVSIWYRHVQ